MGSETWVSLTDVLSPRAQRLDPVRQAELRAAAVNHGQVEFVRALVEGRLPGEDWRHRAACREGSTGALFFPSPRDPLYAPKQEWKRNVRVEGAQGICNGGDTGPGGITYLPCPVRNQCMAFGMRIAGSDKIAIFGGVTWNQRKKILAELRWEAWERKALGLENDPITWREWWQQLRHVRRIALGRALPVSEPEWQAQVKILKDSALGRKPRAPSKAKAKVAA